ncbi:MAG: hypothetical protein ACREJV_11320 [Candidatus Rokuibacteriota bacterium]
MSVLGSSRFRPLRMLVTSLVVAGLVGSSHPALAEDEWYLTLYGGQYAGSASADVVKLSSPDSYVVGLGVLKEFARHDPHVRWELEGLTLQHVGLQDHVEFAASINVRWVTFPWDADLRTSLGFGSGLSYATEVPELEARDNPDTGSTRFLHYLMLELTFSLPSLPRWSLVGRVHHRSGAWGLFDGVGRASNVLVGGLRYQF